VLEYATIMVSDELIRPEHIHLATVKPPPGAPETATVDFQISLPPDEISLDAITGKILDMALQRCGGNKSQAAALLKVNRKMFYR
jgi:DNA-binding NtrC family response regulator